MSKFVKILFLIIVFAAGSKVYSQGIFWQKIFGDQYVEEGEDVIQLRDGGYLMVGVKFSPIRPYLAKLDKFGNILWQKLVDSSHAGDCQSVVEDPFGNIYLPVSGARLIKLDSTGTILWDKYYTSTNIKFFTGISFIDNYKNLMLVGLNLVSSDYTSSLTKLDSSGNLIWNRAYFDSIPSFSPYSSYSNCYLFTDNFYFLCGNKGINGFIIKTDTSGNRLWTQRYTQSEYIFSMVKNSESTYIALGEAMVGDVYCLKFDLNGDTIWTKHYNSAYGPYKIAQTYNHNYAMGTTRGGNFIKVGIIDSSGNIISTYTNYYPQNIAVYLINLNPVSDSGLIFTGSYEPDSTHRSDFIIIKMDKYGNLVSIKNNNEIVSENFEINTFPNPYNLSFKLSFNLKQSSKVIAELFDLTGRRVKEIENRYLNFGNHQYIISTPELSSGIYFIRLNINNKIYSKKILLIK
jgi:Secretion system C-terminal sorting domain